MKKPYPILENILITDVAAEGKALARVGDMVVFVPYVVPGDVVDIQLTKKKKNYKSNGKQKLRIKFYDKAEELIENSFLSDKLKKEYRMLYHTRINSFLKIY